MPAGKAAERFIRKHSDSVSDSGTGNYYQQNLSDNLNLLRLRMTSVHGPMHEGAAEVATRDELLRLMSSEPKQAEAAPEPKALRLCDSKSAAGEAVGDSMSLTSARSVKQDPVRGYVSPGLDNRSCRSQASSESGSTLLSDAPPGHVWQANSDATSCTNSECGVRFGIMNRRHHCRLCGFVSVCSNSIVLRVSSSD